MADVAPAGTQGGPPTPAEWEAPEEPYPASDRAGLLSLVVVPAVLVSVVVAFFTGAWWLGALLVALWAVKTWIDAYSRDPVMLRRLGARPLAPHEAPRLKNISEGLAGDLKVPPPALFVLEQGGPNAFVRKGGPGGILAVTQSLVDGYTRTELEAVVAHCLLRLHSENFVFSSLAARWSHLGAGLAPRVGRADDVSACALTRYPPALATALAKADGRVTRYVPLWFAADAPSHEPTHQRVAALAEL